MQIVGFTKSMILTQMAQGAGATNFKSNEWWGSAAACNQTQWLEANPNPAVPPPSPWKLKKMLCWRRTPIRPS